MVGALSALGCETIVESEYHVALCRGATVIQRIRKLSPVPVRAQRRIFERLSFTEDEYLSALAGLPAE